MWGVVVVVVVVLGPVEMMRLGRVVLSIEFEFDGEIGRGILV
jgi:hypothetical protein